MSAFMRFTATDEPNVATFLDSLHSGLVSEKTQNVQFFKVSLVATDAQLQGTRGHFKGEEKP